MTLARCYESLIEHGVGQTCHKKPLYTAYYYQRNRIRFCRRFLTGETLEKTLYAIGMNLNDYEKRGKEKNDKNRLEYLELLRKELTAPIAAL